MSSKIPSESSYGYHTATDELASNVGYPYEGASV